MQHSRADEAYPCAALQGYQLQGAPRQLLEGPREIDGAAPEPLVAAETEQGTGQAAGPWALAHQPESAHATQPLIMAGGHSAPLWHPNAALHPLKLSACLLSDYSACFMSDEMHINADMHSQ
jgi:hypothetical protein